MLSTSQLNVSSFTEITFASTSCEIDAETLIITGDMTLRGTTRAHFHLMWISMRATMNSLCLVPLTSIILILILSHTVPLVDSSNSHLLRFHSTCLVSPSSSTIWGVSVFDRC